MIWDDPFPYLDDYGWEKKLLKSKEKSIHVTIVLFENCLAFKIFHQNSYIMHYSSAIFNASRPIKIKAEIYYSPHSLIIKEMNIYFRNALNQHKNKNIILM